MKKKRNLTNFLTRSVQASRVTSDKQFYSENEKSILNEEKHFSYSDFYGFSWISPGDI